LILQVPDNHCRHMSYNIRAAAKDAPCTVQTEQHAWVHAKITSLPVVVHDAT
jgi:hypothetical protein